MSMASAATASGVGLAPAASVRAALRRAPTSRVVPRRGLYCKAVAAPISPVELKPPANLHGFELLREEYVAEYDAKVFLFKHEKTGAEVMSLSNDDENKTFGVTFRTPFQLHRHPHILEHSVLCGSRKYPIKEPFVRAHQGFPQHLPQRHDLPRSHVLPRGVLQPPGFQEPRRRVPGRGVPPSYDEREDRSRRRAGTTSSMIRTAR